MPDSEGLSFVSVQHLFSFRILFTSCIAYMFTVRCFRYRRAASFQKKFGMLDRRSFGRMTADQAQSILKDLTELEFPKLMGFSIIFALFKTYGIPSVSRLLVATGQLADIQTASKRTADTGVLLLEFALNPPSSDRTIRAITRMNYLHSVYQKAGKISNDDMLYTLSLFALEPIRWIEKFEWRSLTDVERCAIGTYWKAMGDAMLISYDEISTSQTGWKDGLQWLEEIERWSVRYEVTNMKYAQSNESLAKSHLEVLFVNLPPRLLLVGQKVISVLIGERLQRAMGFPTASLGYHRVIFSVLAARKYFLRYLALPRPEFRRKKYLPDGPSDQSGRYNAKEYLSYPWYVKPTVGSRWGPKAWITRILGRKLPGDDDNSYAPEGYLFEEIGPKAFVGKGAEEMNETRSRLTDMRRGGCPFGVPG